MTDRTKLRDRLLLALLVPPLLGATLLQTYFAAASFVKGTTVATWPIGLLMLIPGYAFAGFFVCLVPGLACWGLLELVWKHGGPGARRRAVFGGVGGGLGVLAGVAVGLGIMEHHALPGGIVGSIAGLVTAVLIHGRH